MSVPFSRDKGQDQYERHFSPCFEVSKERGNIDHLIHFLWITRLELPLDDEAPALDRKHQSSLIPFLWITEKFCWETQILAAGNRSVLEKSGKLIILLDSLEKSLLLVIRLNNRMFISLAIGIWFSDCSSISIAPSVFSSKEGFRHECYAMQGRLFFAPLLPGLGSSWLGSCQAKMNSILGIQAYETFLRHEEVDVFFLCFFSNASCIHCWPKCFCYSSTRSNMLFLVLQTDYFP